MAMKETGLPMMVAKKVGGNPVTPTPSPTTTLGKKKTVATNKATSKKVGKVKRTQLKSKAIKKPAIKKSGY